ncbi:hypothetical protein HK098_000806 [Nowakowskiella sp. JEL0407]|nr:hypothetical protein HK098_000806 [Nowakowskiella sp. JEL0407]
MCIETILWIQQKTQKLLSSPKYENNPKLLSKIINVHYSLVPIYTTKMRTEVEICENFAIVVAYFMNRVEQGMQQIEFDDEEFTTTVKKEKRSGKGRGKGDIIELHWICVLEFVELLDEYLQSLVKFYKVGELWVDYVNNLCGGWFLFDFCGADADANRKGKNGKKEKGTKVEDSDDEVAVDQRKEGVDVDSEGWEMILSDCFAYYFMASFVPGVFVDCCVGVLNIFRGVSFDRRFGGGDDLVEIVKEDSGKRAVKSLDVDSDVEDVIEVDNDDGQVLATEARFLGVTVFEFVKRVFCSMFTKITGQEYDDAMYKRFYLEVLRQIVYRYAAENDKGGELGVERLIEGFPWRVFGIESKKEFLRVVEVDLWCGFMASKGGVDAEDFVEKNLESVVVNLLPKKHNQNLNIPQQQNLLRIANQKKFEKKFTSSILQIASKLLFTVGWINIPVSDLEVMAVLKEFFGFWSGAEPEFSCETGMKLDLDADQWVGVQWYDAESVLSSLSEIAQVGGFENIRGLFADQTLSILQTFHEKITTSLYNSTKFHYFQGYAFFIALNYKSLMHPFYFPYVYNFLSRSFNNKVLQSTALGVTRFLLLYLGSTRSDILLDYLIFITETLTSICTENTDPNSETDLLVKLQIKEILSELYSTVPEIKSNCVQSQIAFLQIPHEFRPDGFNQDAVSPNECIPIILDSLVSYQLEKKLGLIRVLKGILKVAGGVEENLRLLIFRAMKTLLYQLPSDSEEGIDVGFCMGYLIGVDEGNRCDENESKSSGHLHSLTQLSRYLLFEDVLVVGSIIELLYNVAATDIGLELISQLPHKVRSVLEIFTVNGKKEKSSAFKWTSTHAYLPVQNLSAWRLEDEETKSSGVADDIRVKKWVRNLVNSVLSSCATDEYYIHFGPVFEHLPAFAEAMIPYVFHSALLNEIKNAESEELPIRAKISENLTRFFTTTLEIPHFDEATARVVKILLSILEFLQTQSIPVTDAVPRTGQNQWLQVDYKLIASIATRVKNWNVALYFLELEYSSTLSAEGTTIEDETLKRDEMLFQIYKNLNDPDGFDGILEIYQPNIEAAMDSVLVQKFERDKEWLKLLDYHETHAQFEETAGNSAAVGAESHSLGILKSLNELKLYQVSCGFASSFGIIKLDENKNGDESKRSRASEVFYESCWRTGNFQKSLEFPGNDSITGFHQIICNSIKAINEQQTQTIPELINRGMSDSLLSLQNIHKSKFQESLIPIYILDEIQQCANVLHSDDRERDMSKMFSEWNNRLNTFDRSMSYSEVEMLLSVRTSLLRVIHNTVEDRFRQDSGLVEFFDGHLQRVCKLARKSGSYKEANDAFEILRQLHNGKVPLDGIIGRLKTIWSQGEQSTAIRTLKLVLKTDKEPVLLILLGRWISELRIENPITINETYFQKAIKQTVSEPNKLGKLYHHLAKFTDAIYKTMESDELNNMMQELIKVKLNEVEGLKVVMRAQPTGSDARQAWENQIKKLELQIDIDKSDAARFESDKKNFLNQSIENYLKALAYDSKSDMCVFPLTTLWFLNQDKYEDIHALIESYIPTISSYKFLTLVYQLSARMGAIQLPDGSISLFQRALYRLIYKMTSDHPHHTLPQILALQNGDISHSSDSKNRRQSNPNKPTTLSARAAQFLTSQLKTKVPKLEPVILQMDLLFDAYIEFAMWKPISKDSRALSPKDGVYVLDKRFKLAALGELDHVPVISFDHPVRPNTQYDDLPYIKKFDTTYKLIGGINLPKVVQCIDSTGKAHKQDQNVVLWKKDDLRQDAVLLKIFSLVNDLLKQNPETRRRNLKIRTYRVVPLSPRAGVLEWVENTVTLGNYLSDSHQKYNKNDLSPSECRKKMNREHQNNFSSIESKLAVFGKICNNFRPVFRHFFFENFKDPVEWFERRQTYVRSLACSSITGYVVGLGDRHAQNILFDERTAEIVHIDFGICFDVGRLLSTPEIVPFRLTRDLVDGMGITGVEGAFRNSCEETLQLLRSESSILLAILDVFRFDPLYIWKVTQQRTQQAQRKVQQTLMMTDDKEAKVEPTTSKTENSNNEAERALLGVRKKLEVNVSVKCQVNELIQMAQDERNLCRMFPGWYVFLNDIDLEKNIVNFSIRQPWL